MVRAFVRGVVFEGWKGGSDRAVYEVEFSTDELLGLVVVLCIGWVSVLRLMGCGGLVAS